MVEKKKKGTKPSKSKCRIDDQGRECTKCGKYKEWSEYHSKPGGAKDKAPLCAECEKAKLKAYRAAQPDKVRALQREWRTANPEKSRASRAAWQSANPAKVKEHQKNWRAVNAGEISEYNRRYLSENPERTKARVKAWVASNSEKAKAVHKSWRLANPAKLSEYTQNRRAAKLQAAPAWADRAAMLAIFKESKRLTEETGTEHHVDHIIPLQHPLVIGLHVPANLKPVPARLNCSKHNKFDSNLYAEHDLEAYYKALLGSAASGC